MYSRKNVNLFITYKRPKRLTLNGKTSTGPIQMFFTCGMEPATASPAASAETVCMFV